jgi:hypothetical protein
MSIFQCYPDIWVEQSSLNNLSSNINTGVTSYIYYTKRTGGGEYLLKTKMGTAERL